MAEQVSKLRLKYGEIELEIEGNDALIERERIEFQKTVIPALEVFLNKMKQNSFMSTNSACIDSETVIDDKKLLLDLGQRDCTYANFAHFLKEKGFNSNVDKVVAAVYYISEIDKKNVVTRDDIEQELKNAKLPSMTNISSSINVNIKKAYIEEVEKIDNKRAFRILQPGIDFCETFVFKEEHSKKTAKFSKDCRNKLVKDYPSLSYSVDDLHIDNYCDLSKLDKYIEQIWVLLYIYYKETNQQTFTRDEVSQLLRKRFAINPSDRQIKRFFETAGNKLHKEGSTKFMKYTLMQGGIDEAKRIIEEHSV